MHSIWILLVLSLVSPTLLAQSGVHRRSAASNGISRKKSYDRRAYLPFSLSLRTGMTQFFGELDDQDMRGMFGAGISGSFNKQLGMLVNVSAGKVGGENPDFFHSYFVNEYNAAEILVKWDVTEQFNQYEPGRLHVYLEGGAGLLLFSANAYDLDSGALLRFTNSTRSARNPLFLRWGKPHGPVGVKKTREGLLPLGTSADYRLLEHWLLGVEYHFYFIRTDKADATSGRSLTNPEESGSYSDTPNDKFSYLSFSVTYQFGSRRKK